jgi:sugar phosphate isomerase/epimerase
MSLSRRGFLHRAAAAVAAAGLAEAAGAFPLGLVPGLQLWTVGKELEANEDQTLREIARIGYRELELFELPKAPREFRKKCDGLGLRIVGGHFYLNALRRHATIDGAHELGLKYLIVVFPTLRAWADKDISRMSVRELTPAYEKISLADYQWNAEQFNEIGVKVKREGLQLGYHNHAIDFKRLDGTTGLDTLIGATSPGQVVFEMDCGHVIHAGFDPIAYLEKYPARIELLHLKDLKRGYQVSASLDTEERDTNAELGSGVIDWHRLFAVAGRGSVRHYFVEHEGEMDRSHLEAIKVSYDYLRQFS